MPRDQTVIKNDYRFRLCGRDATCYYKEVMADYTPPITLNSSLCSIVPAFQRDGLYYTPSFIVPRLQKQLALTPSSYKRSFEQDVLKDRKLCQELQLTALTQSFSAACPTSSYCSVCKDSFDSYFDHILTEPHLAVLRAKKLVTRVWQRNCQNKQIRKKEKRIGKIGAQHNKGRGPLTNRKRISKPAALASTGATTNIGSGAMPEF